MNRVKKSSENEAVLEWLKAELSSDSFSGDLRRAMETFGCGEKS